MMQTVSPWVFRTLPPLPSLQSPWPFSNRPAVYSRCCFIFGSVRARIPFAPLHHLPPMSTSCPSAVSDTLLKNISTHKAHSQVDILSSTHCYTDSDIFMFNLIQVNHKSLAATQSQQHEISKLYAAKKEVSLVFNASPADQADAQQFMLLYGLDRTTRDALESRWNIAWSAGWKVGDDGDQRRRCLLQWYALITHRSAFVVLNGL